MKISVFLAAVLLIPVSALARPPAVSSCDECSCTVGRSIWRTHGCGEKKPNPVYATPVMLVVVVIRIDPTQFINQMKLNWWFTMKSNRNLMRPEMKSAKNETALHIPQLKLNVDF